MKTLIASVFLSLLFVSCITINERAPQSDTSNNENNTYGQAYTETNYNGDENTLEVSEDNPSGFFKKLSDNTKKEHQFIDARTGIVISSTQYPASWNVISKPSYTVDQKIPVFMIQTSGPNNLKSFNTPIKIHISYQNPQTYQFMQNATYANMHRAMVSNKQILKEEVFPRMQKSGYRYVKDIRLTKSEKFINEKIRTQSAGQVQVEFAATVWENDKGQKALASVGKIYMQQPLSYIDTMTLWMYSADYTFVDADYFDETIAAFEDALINTHETSQWKQYVTQLSQQRQQKAMQKHQNHMQNRQAAFNAHQKKMQGIWAAQDANHASFMNRTFGSGSSTSHQKFVNMINEEETVYNPLDGETYQVNAFSEQNWMDSNGNLIQNNDLFYTPNGDINLNNREWVKVGSIY